MSEFFDTPLSDVIALQNDKKAQLKTFEYQSSGVLPIIDQSSKFICGYTDDFSKKYSKSLPVIVFGDHTLHTKYIDFDFAVGADGTQIIRTQDPQHEHKYLYYVISREIQIMGSEGYKRHLKILKERVVPFTNSIPEQKKIASILTSVDEVIENTSRQIDKLQDLKKATMNELLTKGIGHTEFKDSELGQIPKSWDVKQLKEVTIKIRDGNYGADYPSASEMLKTGVPFLTSTVIGNNQKIDRGKLKYISREKHTQLSKAHIKKNDVLFTNRGASVGNVAIVGEDLNDANIGPQLTFLRVNENILGEYLYESLQSMYFKIQLNSLDSGSAMNFFGIGTTERLQIAVPPISEQKKIAYVLSATNTTIESKRQKLSQTKSLKKSLMQDLLRGKVRVTVN